MVRAARGSVVIVQRQGISGWFGGVGTGLKRVHGLGCKKVVSQKELKVVWWREHWFKEGAWFGRQESG